MTARVHHADLRGSRQAEYDWPGAMLPRCLRKHVPSTVVRGCTCFPKRRGSMARGIRGEESIAVAHSRNRR